MGLRPIYEAELDLVTSGRRGAEANTQLLAEVFE